MLDRSAVRSTNLPGIITVQPCHRGFIVNQYGTLLAVSTVDELAGLVADLVQNPHAAAQYAEGAYLGAAPKNVVPFVAPFVAQPVPDWEPASDQPSDQPPPPQEEADPVLVRARQEQNVRFLARQVLSQAMSLEDMMNSRAEYFPDVPTDTVAALMSEAESEMFQTAGQ